VRNELLQLPGSVLGRLKEALRMGFVKAPYELAALRSHVGADLVEQVGRALRELAAKGVADRGVVALLEAVEAARAEVPRPSLVWTGPEVQGLHARGTREVFDELIGRATSSLWISTFAYFDGKTAFQVLAERMDAVRSLSVKLMLNIHYHPDSPGPEDSVSRARWMLWEKNWPGVRRPDVYYFPESLVEDRSQTAVLHAKAIVRDEEEVLVTSANFTDAALSRNIELGVLLHDAPFARTVVRHYQRLIESGRLLALGRD
jgi:hypothetical protein